MRFIQIVYFKDVRRQCNLIHSVKKTNLFCSDTAKYLTEIYWFLYIISFHLGAHSVQKKRLFGYGKHGGSVTNVRMLDEVL